MQGSEFDEAEFFRAIGASGARALLIGRRALVALGIPVLTADYDCWIHIDDIAVFNTAVEPQGLFPTRTPDEARGNLILTKRFGGRPKDLEDIRLLEALRKEER